MWSVHTRTIAYPPACDAQVHADAKHAQLEDSVASHARQGARREHERRGLEMQLGEVLARVREHEKGVVGEQPSWARTLPRPDLTPSGLRAMTPRGGPGLSLPIVHAAALPVPRVLGRRMESSPRESVLAAGLSGAGLAGAGLRDGNEPSPVKPKHSPRRPLGAPSSSRN